MVMQLHNLLLQIGIFSIFMNEIQQSDCNFCCDTKKPCISCIQSLKIDHIEMKKKVMLSNIKFFSFTLDLLSKVISVRWKIHIIRFGSNMNEALSA